MDTRESPVPDWLESIVCFSASWHCPSGTRKPKKIYFGSQFGVGLPVEAWETAEVGCRKTQSWEIWDKRWWAVLRPKLEFHLVSLGKDRWVHGKRPLPRPWRINLTKSVLVLDVNPNLVLTSFWGLTTGRSYWHPKFPFCNCNNTGVSFRLAQQTFQQKNSNRTCFRAHPLMHCFCLRILPLFTKRAVINNAVSSSHSQVDTNKCSVQMGRNFAPALWPWEPVVQFSCSLSGIFLWERMLLFGIRKTIVTDAVHAVGPVQTTEGEDNWLTYLSRKQFGIKLMWS